MTQNKKKKDNQYKLIGKEIKIKSPKNNCTSHIEGKVIDETKKTIYVKTKKGRKRLIKNNQEVIIK